jgi:hypothetical protein
MASSTGTWWSVSSSTFLADVSVTTGSENSRTNGRR